MTNVANIAPGKAPGPNEHCWCGSRLKYKRCHQSSDAQGNAKRSSPPGHAVVQGKISPRRTVPPQIARPEYAISGRPGPNRGSEVKSAEVLERMRRVCRLSANLLAELSTRARVGVTTEELDAFAHQWAIDHGAYPSPLNYRGYPKSICTSVNEVICHGIPDDRPLADGDIVNLDVTLFFEGVHGDCSATVFVGDVGEESKRLVRVTKECLDLGIAAVKPGEPINAIGRAIERHASAHGYSVVPAYCGHGIGERFHTELQIPHYYERGANLRMVPGMTFTIEPMIAVGTGESYVWEDDWTAVTADLKRTAQFEHTIAVTEQGAEILTLPG